MNKMDKIYHYINIMDTVLMQWAKENGISYNQLAVFYSIDLYENCTQRRVSEEWKIPKQTLSTVCNQLKSDGLIEFSSGVDKREKTMTLTHRGCEAATPILNKLREEEKNIFVQFGDKNTTLLLDLLQQFSELLIQGMKK